MVGPRFLPLLEMGIANPLWGAPRIHGELLKLGIDVGQTTVARYMNRPGKPPSQGWKAFLRNHGEGIVAMGLFVVPTISFKVLYGLVMMSHGPAKDTPPVGHSAPDSRMDRPSTHRSRRLEPGTTLCHSRPGRCLW